MASPHLVIASYHLAHTLLDSTPGQQFKHVISINNPEEEPPKPLRDHPARKLVLHFHDVVRAEAFHMTPPSPGDVSRIIAFAEDMGQDEDVLIHCAAGISRSSAAALAVIAVKSKERGEDPGERASRCIRELLDVKRSVHPNPDMVEYIDTQLGFAGSLMAARTETFRGF